MTIFSKIIAGEIPSYKCAESERFYAFLDINPVGKGHTLVVPKKEVDYLFDMDDEELAAMMVFAKKVARAIKSVIPCRKVGVAVLGLEVNHAHVHLIPLQSEGDMDFRNKSSSARSRCSRLLPTSFRPLSRRPETGPYNPAPGSGKETNIPVSCRSRMRGCSSFRAEMAV